MRRTMVAVAGSITANWFAVWTATITQCEPASYWVLPASPPSSTCATTVLVVASITKSRPPDSSETKTRRSPGAYAMPSGTRGPGQDAGHRRKPVQISDDSPGAYVEDHQLSGAHVRDEQSPGCGREALVVEARRAPRQRYIGDHAEGRFRRRRRRNGARPMGLDRWTGKLAGWRRHLRCRGEHECSERAREH